MFARDFNELLNTILTMYKNMTPIEMQDVMKLKQERPEIYAAYLTQARPDCSEGSILFMRAAALASMIYGILKSADKVVDQFFVDTAIRKYLEWQAADYGVISTGKTDVLLAAELKAKKSGRKMGGNRYDYIDWAKEVSLDYVVANPASGQLTNDGFAEFTAAACIDSATVAKAWSTDAIEAGASISIDLELIRRAYTKLRLFLSGAESETAYEISFSDNKTDWTVAAQITPALAGWNEVSWTINAAHRYWKLTLTSTDLSGPFVTEMEWSEGPERVVDALVYPLAQGEGTFDVVIISNLARGIASQDLLDAVYAKLDENRPVVAGFSWGLRVLTGQLVCQDIVITGSGVNWDTEKTVEDIFAYTELLTIGQTLYLAQLQSIAIQNGAETALVTSPAADITPLVNEAAGIYQVIRPGDVTIA